MAKKKKYVTKRPAAPVNPHSPASPPNPAAANEGAKSAESASAQAPKNPLSEAFDQVREAITTVMPAAAPMIDSISDAASNAVETLSKPSTIPDALARMADTVNTIVERGLEAVDDVLAETGGKSDVPSAGAQPSTKPSAPEAPREADLSSKPSGTARATAKTSNPAASTKNSTGKADGTAARKPPARKDTATAPAATRKEPVGKKDSAIEEKSPASVLRDDRRHESHTYGTSHPALDKPAMTAENFSLLTSDDLHLFNEGTHQQLYNKLGAHIVEVGGTSGTYFATWAPNAARVSVIGHFNRWEKGVTPLRPVEHSGLWEVFVPGVGVGETYKYHIVASGSHYEVDKADPFGFRHQVPPHTASVVAELDYKWGDAAWMAKRQKHNSLASPMSLYEVHLGSWRRVIEEEGRSLTYREIAPLLAQHMKDAGFTHLELMPVMEHPFFGSWGYQVTGYYAPSSRFGSPTDLMYLIDHLHQNDIGVILDWVPSHFPTDEHGLSYFDGTHLFEHEDPRQGFHPDWKSLIFNFGRNEVRSFLLSNAIYWLDKFHADGLRVDGVASMLYLDYSRKQDEWIPNKYGGRENLEAVGFLRQVNDAAYTFDHSIQMIAEESTAWPMVSRPSYVGGLGFGMKWDMGWMHDTLRYMSQDPIHRRFHHNALTFRMMYAYTENFVLSLSHDEVVHGKGSLIRKMPGDDWRKFANLRLLYAYMYAQPGKKLLFMGSEIAQWREWDHDGSLDWYLLDDPQHAGILSWMRELNRAYSTIGAFFELDCQPGGFEWIDCNDSENSVVSCLRRGNAEDDVVIGVFNFTPVLRHNYQIGVPHGGFWKEILNSDAAEYGGSAQGNYGGVEAAPITLHGRPWAVTLTLPPLGAIFLRRGEFAE